MDSRKKTLTILLALISITSLIAVTYAYFGIEVGENQNQEITMNSANLSLKYTDCASSNQEHCNNLTASLAPGDELIKTFEIENTGTGPSEFQLYFKELMNTFKNDELVFKIENLETGVVLLEESPVPYNELKVFNVPIELNDTIPAQTTHKYKFTIKFLNTDYDQSENVDAEFIIKLGLLEVAPDTTTSNAFTFYLGNSASTTYTDTLSTTANISWEEDDINSCCVTTASTSANCTWNKVSGKSTTQNVTLTGSEGLKTVYAYLKDDAGNISSSVADQIYYDTANPVVNSVTTDEVTTTSIKVTVNASDANGISKYYYSSNGGASYNSSTSNTYTFSNLNPSTNYNIKIYVEDKSKRNSSVMSQTAKTSSIIDKIIASSKGVAPTSTFANISPPFESYIDNEFSGNATSRSMSSYSSRYITYADSYTFNASTGTYTLVNPQIGQYSSIYSSLANKYIVSTTGSTSTSLATYTNRSTIYKVTSSTTSSTMYYITSGKTEKYGTESGIYEMEDDYGTSYYFRGAPENNYVSFAGYCWRIIRINGDGSLRLIYDGTSCHANGESSTDRLVNTSTAFNDDYGDNAYVGYMYGLTGITTDANRCLMLDSSNNVVDNVSTYTTKSACESAGGKWTTTAYEATHANVKDSTIKDYLDAWYKTNIVDKGYGENIADTSFCGDRSMGTSNNLGYGTNTTYYGPRNRLNSAKTPQLKCPQKQDAYTVSDETNGNGDLEYPVGLISADEVSLAGGVAGTGNSGYYLYKGSFYWPLSPSAFSGYGAFVFYVGCSGDLYFGGVNDTDGVAPVINLTKEYASKLTGDGSKDIPYIFSS